MIRSAAGLETPNSGASCRKVRFVRQYAATQDSVLQRQAPGATSAHRVGALPPQRGHELPELSWAQPGERGYPGGVRRRDHTSHGEIVSP